jgi:hypothetical protein
MAVTNDVEVILIKPKRIVALSTGATDPFLVLSGPLTADISDSFSKFWITKVVISLLILLGQIISQKKIFDVKTKI